MPSEQLPTGFTRRRSGSLRVQIRLKGFAPVVKNFPLVSTEPSEKKRQLVEAEAWAAETRLGMLAGSHVSSREAERTSLAEALRRYEAEGMNGSESNRTVDRYRIQIILRDPISERPVAHLGVKDVAAFRDRLIRAGWLKNVDAALRRLAKSGATKQEIEAIRGLPRLKDAAEQASDPTGRRTIEATIAALEDRAGIKPPARSSVVNVTQLISRALKHLRQTMDSVPEIRNVPMPKASPGRERRLSASEIELLLHQGKAIHPSLPLMIRFAIVTTLRRGRVLSCRRSDIRDIGGGKQAIAFPRSAAVNNKRTGVIPLTSELRAIIDEAKSLECPEAATASDDRIFAVTPSQLTDRWDKLLDACAIKDLHWHDLRHEGTSRLFERGLSTAEVMSITGHSTQDMVDRYSHYGAAIVHDKLERGSDASALLAELDFLISQFLAAGGRLDQLAALKGVLAKKTPSLYSRCQPDSPVGARKEVAGRRSRPETSKSPRDDVARNRIKVDDGL